MKETIQIPVSVQKRKWIRCMVYTYGLACLLKANMTWGVSEGLKVLQGFGKYCTLCSKQYRLI